MTMIWINGQTVTGSSTGTITFDNIPQTFTHLQLRVFSRSSSAINSGSIYIRANSDSTTNYVYHELVGDGGGAGSGANTSMTVFFISRSAAGGNASANIFGTAIADFLDYNNTNKFKTMRSIAGQDRNGSGDVTMNSALWRSTNAITRFDVFGDGNFVAGSRIDLYGITTSALTGA